MLGDSQERDRARATYSADDFKRIAAAIGKDVAGVQRQEKAFQAAALWYWLSRIAPEGKRIAPSAMRNRMTKIANAAQRLLEHLGVSDPAQAPDGPATAVLEATNAAKYGSLTAPSGKVRLSWAIERDSLAVEWAETEGPAVQVPAAQGYGTRVIKGSLEQLGGRAEFDWRRDGVCCTLTVPLSRRGRLLRSNSPRSRRPRRSRERVLATESCSSKTSPWWP